MHLVLLAASATLLGLGVWIRLRPVEPARRVSQHSAESRRAERGAREEASGQIETRAVMSPALHRAAWGGALIAISVAAIAVAMSAYAVVTGGDFSEGDKPGGLGWLGLFAQSAILSAVLAHIAWAALSVAEGRVPSPPSLHWSIPLIALLVWPVMPLYEHAVNGGIDMNPWNQLSAAAMLMAGWFLFLWIRGVRGSRGSPARSLDRGSKRRTPRRAIAVLVMMFLVAATTIGLASPSAAAEATVERVVDGDTIDVRMPGGSLQRVRLLNIDTPETVDPNRPEECLGHEATSFVKSRVSPGDSVDLEFDHDRRDRYGRLLAHVRLGSGRLLSEEIATAGLGVPISIGRNSTGYSAVADAANRADSRNVGYFDPKTECTLPAQTSALGPALDQASKVQMGSTANDAQDAAESLERIATPFLALYNLTISDASFVVRSHTFLGSNSATTGDYERRFNELWEMVTSTEQLAEKRATAEAEEKARRKAAEAKRKAELKAQREAAERAQEEALERARQEAERRQAEQRNDRDGSGGGGSGSGGGDGGYTGCRAYDPGGVTWKPIPCP